jgi:hypothetical protein
VRCDALADEVADAVGFTQESIDALRLGFGKLNMAVFLEFCQQADSSLDTPVEDTGTLGLDQSSREVRNRLFRGWLRRQASASESSRT